ncbi:MAG: hypothetical protein M3P44_00660 [Actinomycetota bacterium]|nr:hypothetical protein [Actinomycetota bacterium]
MFPTDGRNPFPTADMLAVVAFCVVIVMLTGGDGRVRTLRWIFVVYGVATIGSYLVPSAVGAGVARFQFVALPLALLALSLRSRGARRRVLPLLAVILAAWINVPALASSFVNGARTDASTVAYWQPAIAFLRAHRSPSYRVEVVDTIGHWPAVYLARAGVPLARGWFRQDDFPQNAVLYGALDAGSYATWLQILGVRYVVLSDTTPDYSAQREARLLRSGRSGLTLVHRAPQLSIYEVRSPTPIIVGPHRARVLSLTQDGIAVALAGPGTYRLAVRYTPYWRPSTGCVSRAADGMTFLTVGQGGRARIDFSWSSGRALDAVVGQAASSCATGRRPARGR